MEYMIVYPLPKNYKNTPDNNQKILEKFEKFLETSKFPMKEHTLDHVYNTYKKIHKYVCLSSSMERPEYYENRPADARWDNYIILYEDDNNILIGEL